MYSHSKGHYFSGAMVLVLSLILSAPIYAHGGGFHGGGFHGGGGHYHGWGHYHGGYNRGYYGGWGWAIPFGVIGATVYGPDCSIVRQCNHRGQCIEYEECY